MTKNKKLIISAFILSAVFFSSVAIAATVLFPSGGGTGTNTKPGKGSILVGASSTAYSPLATSTNGKVLTTSSTATLGVSWETVTAASTPAGSNTQIQYNNGGLTAADASFTFSSSSQNVTMGSSTVTNLNFTNATGTQLSLPHISAIAKFNSSGILGTATSGTDYQRPLASNEYVSSTAAGTGISVSGASGAVTITNIGVQTVTAGTGIAVSATTGTPTITNIGVQSLTAGSSTLVTSATGTPTLSIRPYSWQFIGIYSTSSQNTTGVSDNIAIADTTSTIRNVRCVNMAGSPDTITFNLAYLGLGSSFTSQATTSPGFRVFSADQTLINTTSTNFVPTASTTIPLGGIVRFWAKNASSTETSCTVYYDQS